MSDESISLKMLVKGQFSKRFLTRVYLPVVFLQLGFFYILAIWQYEGYDFTHMDISFLGSPYGNPSGWYYWAIGMTVAGILFFPTVPYIYRALVRMNRGIAYIVTFLLVGFGIGMIGLGIIPQYRHLTVYHGINTALAFGGLYLSLLVLLFYFTIKFQIVNASKWLPVSILVIMALLEFIPLLGMVISQGIRISQGIDIVWDRSCLNGIICPWYMTISFWEWMMFFGAVGNLILFSFSLPNPNDNP